MRHMPWKRGFALLLLTLIFWQPFRGFRIVAFDYPDTVEVANAGRVYGMKRQGADAWFNDYRMPDKGGPDGQGTLFYCLEYDFDGHDATTERRTVEEMMPPETRDGYRFILDHGFPNTTKEVLATYGIGAEEANAATRAAIWAYGQHMGIGHNEGFPGLEAYEENGAKKLATQLVQGALNPGQQKEPSLTVDPPTPTWEADGQQFVARFVVNGHFDDARMVLPEGVTGPKKVQAGQKVTVKASAATMRTLPTFTLIPRIYGGSPAVYGWYDGPEELQKQNFVAAPRLEEVPREGPSTKLQPAAAVGGLTLVKSDEAGHPLDGARFELRDARGKVVTLRGEAPDYRVGSGADTFTTHKGRARIQGLQAGTYTLHEVEPPEGYVAADAMDVTVTAGQTADAHEVPCVNVRQHLRIKIHKQDAETELSLSGAVFRVFAEDGTTPATDIHGKPLGDLTTDDNGDAITPELLPGRYVIREVGAPDGYLSADLSDSLPMIVNAPANRDSEHLSASVLCTNRAQRGVIRIVKQDADHETPLEGARFRLYTETGEPAQDADGQDVPELVTDAEGRCETPSLPLGVYVLVETQAPAGYLPGTAEPDTEGRRIELSYGGMDTPRVVETVTMTNQRRKIVLIIRKVDGETGTSVPSQPRYPLADARFTIFEADGETVATAWADGQPLENLAPDPDTGVLRTPALVPGTYVIEETTVPEGYRIPDEPVRVVAEARDGELVTEHEVLLSNAPKKVRFHLQKEDAETGTVTPRGYSLEADFAIIRVATDETVAVLSTDAEGRAVSPLLPLDDYRIEEQRPPWGYRTSDTNFSWSADAASEDAVTDVAVNFRNHVQTVGLRLVKYDDSVKEEDDAEAVDAPERPATERGLAGAVFDLVWLGPVGGPEAELTFEDKELETLWEDPRYARELVTGEDGTARAEGLMPGRYRLTERMAPEGYVRREDLPEVLLPYDSEAASDLAADMPLYEVHVSNEKIRGSVEVLKLDALSGDPLPGVRFRLLPVKWQDGAFTAEGVTDDEGRWLVEQVPYGDYLVREIEGLPGYRPETEDITLRIESSGQHVTIRRTNTPTEVDFTKVDDETEAPLSGATFGLWAQGQEEADSPLQTATSDDNGRVIWRYLAPGTYIFREISAPEGYVPDETRYTLTVDEAGGWSAPDIKDGKLRNRRIQPVIEPEPVEIPDMGDPKAEGDRVSDRRLEGWISTEARQKKRRREDDDAHRA